MRVSVTQIREMKPKGEKIAMLTAYDYATAKLIDEAGIPLILVGDSLGMVILGYESTIPVTMDEMIHHTKAVVRGTSKALVIGDMPFMTYQVSIDDALRNAARFIQEGGAQAVKLEGGESMADTVRRVVSCGIPVMGHIGLTPQSIHQLGGFKVVGKTSEAAVRLVNDAKALDDAGVFSIVLEAVPEPLSKLITEKVSVPTIGIGAGKYCDGQVQVISDLLGLYTDFVPKHAKQYARLFEVIKSATSEYIAEVQAGTFPTEKQSYTMDASILDELQKVT
ncbi:MAG: 3-methyl-2-oxobutanoate hydroxymethyltransferase [Chloroflexota bacterium]|nr:3-methyl-2-oxobutanoate hydroxymethyltransferase [Chloroflexota bacterium]